MSTKTGRDGTLDRLITESATMLDNQLGLNLKNSRRSISTKLIDHRTLISECQFNSITYYLLAIFIFVAPAMPMPSINRFGFISPLFVGFLGLFIIYNFLTRRPVMVVNRYVVTILIFYLMLLMSDLFCLFLFEPKSQLNYLIARIATLVIFVAAISYKPSLDQIEWMIRVYCWSIAALSVLVILEGFGVVSLGAETRQGRTYFGIQLPFRKAVGFPMSDGEFGIMTAPAFLYFLLQHFGGKDYKPMRFRTVGLLLTATALLIAQSRSTWLSLAVALSVIGLLLPRRNIDRVLLLAAGVAVLALIGPQVYDKIYTGFLGEGILAKNVSTRFETFHTAIELAKEAPIFGIGHDALIVMSPVDHMDSRLIHNHFLDALQAGGFLAFLPVISLYGIVIITMLRQARTTAIDDPVRLLSIWNLGAMLIAVVELNFYRGFYSEHIPWFIGTSAMLVALKRGWRPVIP